MISKHPIVSICIPAYNRPEFIRQCVLSCLSQSYSNKEVIVSDDSEENQIQNQLKDLIEKRAIKYNKNTKRLGRLENYRKLLCELSNGEWAIMVDGDDYLTDDLYIEKSIEWLLEQTCEVNYIHAAHFVNYQKGESKSSDFVLLEGSSYLRNPVKFCSKFSHLSSLYSREKAIQNSFYQYNDLHGFLNLASTGFVGYYPKAVGVWRDIPASESKSIRQSDLRNIFIYFQDEKEINQVLIRKIMKRYIFYYFLNYLYIISNLAFNERSSSLNSLIKISNIKKYYPNWLVSFLILCNRYTLKIVFKILDKLFSYV